MRKMVGRPVVNFRRMLQPKPKAKQDIQPLLAEWDAVNRSTLKAGSARSNRSFLHRFIWRFSVQNPQQITHQLLQELVADLVSQGYKPSSIKVWLMAISAFCNYLVRRRILDENPVPAVRKPPVISDPPAYLRSEQVSRVLELARKYDKKHKCYLPIKLAIYTGLRRGQLRALDWEDIDFVLMQILVRASVSKNRRSYRVPLPLAVLEDLQRVTRQSGPVFRWGRGRRSLRFWDRILVPIKKEMPELRPYGFHIFRHTFASLHVQNGTPLGKVSQWLGHADVKVTMKYYANFVRDDYDPDINNLPV